MNKKAEKYIWPIEPKYKVTEHDKYGIRKNHYVLFNQREHSGFDITADIGTKVFSISTGKVILAEFDGSTTEGYSAFNYGYGNKVEILDTDGRRIVYAHLRKILVSPGDLVTNNSVIGLTGCSGGSRVPHLHLEIRKTDTDQTGFNNTIDPLTVLPNKNIKKLDKEFVQEPYKNLWKIMASEYPWEFKEQDIPYRNDNKYIK